MRILIRIITAPLLLILNAGMLGAQITGIDPRKVAIYIRWSTDDQASGTTLDVQRDACLNQARAWGWGTVPDDRIFVDDGYSGGDLNRPAISRIRQLVRQGAVECVIVYKIDRLSRNIVDAVSLVLHEWTGVCQLKCVTEPIDTTTELGRMIFNILAMFADFERSAIRARTFSGKVRRAAEGRNPGIRLPYGYVSGATAGDIVTDEAKAAVVQEIFELYASGLGMPQIAHRLNARGIPGIRSAHWSITTLQYILTNQAYTGTLVYGRTRKNERRGRADGATTRVANEQPLAVSAGALPVIIQQELFDRCQAIRAGRGAAVVSAGGRSISGEHLLTGIARCTCGRILRARAGANRARTIYYHCPDRWTKGETACNAAWIPQALLDAEVTERLLSLRDPARQAEVRQRYLNAAGSETAMLRQQLAQADQDLANLDVQEAQLRRDYRAGKLSAETLEENRVDIRQERQEKAGARQRLAAQLAASEAGAEQASQQLAHLELLDGWGALTMPERKELLRQIVEQLTVHMDREGRTMTFNLRIKGVV